MFAKRLFTHHQYLSFELTNVVMLGVYTQILYLAENLEDIKNGILLQSILRLQEIHCHYSRCSIIVGINNCAIEEHPQLDAKCELPVRILQNTEFCWKLLPTSPEPLSDALFFILLVQNL